MIDREVLLGCARVRTKCAEKDWYWSVRADYVLEKLPDVSGSDLVEAGRYRHGGGVDAADLEEFGGGATRKGGRSEKIMRHRLIISAVPYGLIMLLQVESYL